MDEALAIVGGLTLLSAIAAVALRNPVHCALCMAVSFVGVAALFLQLNAQFAGFAQVLVYVGAVAILAVFAILLTRSGDVEIGSPLATRMWGLGLMAALLVLGTLVFAIASSHSLQHAAPELLAQDKARTGVKALGQLLMTDYIVPLEVMGLLLTAAMIGAVVIAMQDKLPPGQTRASEGPGSKTQTTEITGRSPTLSTANAEASAFKEDPK